MYRISMIQKEINENAAAFGEIFLQYFKHLHVASPHPALHVSISM